MRDMLPRSQRSIRNIPVTPAHRRPPVEDHPYYGGDEPPRRRRGARRWFWFLAILVIVIAGAGALLLSTVFAGATITIHPRAQTVTAPSRMSAGLNASPGILPYQSMTLTFSATTTVPATGTEDVARQASGKIKVFNNYSSASQRLIANTRFQAPDGKIYRVKESVDVPGMGSVELTVYADSAGEDYNRTEPTRFTIPGFKGDPRYEKFYGEMSTPITGGFIGEEPAVSDADMEKARTALEQALESALREAAARDIPPDYVLIPGTLSVSFNAPQKGTMNAGSVAVSLSATAVGYIVRLQDLASYIARETVPEYDGEAVNFDDPEALTIALASSTEAADTLELALSGSPLLVWQFDPTEVQKALLGKPKGEFESIVTSFEPAIAKAEARIRPFWQSTFPDNPEKIHIEVSGE